MDKRTVIPAFRKALQAIGYENRLIVENYEFADFTDRESTVSRIPLAAFSGYPHTYRNSCIGVTIANGLTAQDEDVSRYRALGAPLVFEVADGQVQGWTIGPENTRNIGRSFAIGRVESVFEQNKSKWKPDAIGRVKAVAGVKPNRQLDFFDAGLLPVLEQFFQSKLKDLLERAFQETAASYQSVHGTAPDVAFLFPYLFRFVTAKIFMDRADATGWSSLGSPREILEKAERHSGSDLLAQLPKEFLDRKVLEMAWASIFKTVHFQNLSVPDLAFIYESSFINDQTRRELGIHSTPRGLADYIVEHLPWQDIPLEDRRVFEPFSGHGIFLACAMERLNRDLDPQLTPRQRHDYFRRMLIGVEKDPLALEVCRLVLTLSDYPNHNRWQLHRNDVFTWSGWDAALKSAAVVLANPPYEQFSAEERTRINAVKAQPPAELLHRLMRHPPPMVGLVLPQSFLSHPSYHEASRQIANYYSDVSIIELPRLFRYADNETIALLAAGRREHGQSVAVRYGEVKSHEIGMFLSDFRVSVERSRKWRFEDESQRQPFTLWIPPKGSLFKRFEELSKLGQAATLIRKGLNWRARTDRKPRSALRTDVVSDVPRPGYHRGVDKMAKNLAQFQIRTFRYLSLRSQDQDPSTRAEKHPWSSPKVVCNAARFERYSPWRLAGWADVEGLAFSKNYFAIWPKDGISEFALAALVCSPLANLFSFENDLERHNHIATLERIPIPEASHLLPTGQIHSLAQELQNMLATQNFAMERSPEEVREAFLRLDAAVLEAYDVPEREQRRLLEKFQGWKRPVVVPFTGYFPDHFKDVISLQDLVTIQYDWETVNERRCDLIDKEVERQPMTIKERAELDRLQHLADLVIRLKDPYPLEDLDKLINKLKAEGKWQDSI